MTSDRQGETTADFLSGGGELGQLIRSFDWSKTGLGPIDSWPPHLRITLGVILGSPVPIVTLPSSASRMTKASVLLLARAHRAAQ